MTNQRDHARDAAVSKAFQGGHTLQQIGDEYKLSRERVRQLLKRLGLPGRDGGAYVRKQNKSIG